MNRLFSQKGLKKQAFHVDLTIESLNDVPLIRGRFYVKWKLDKGSALLRSDHSTTQGGQPQQDRGQTATSDLINHTAAWDHTVKLNLVVSMDKEDQFQPCLLTLTVKQDIRTGKKAETFGKIQINLSEFIAAAALSNQYLLQDSKTNSTLKLSIEMKQFENDLNGSQYHLDVNDQQSQSNVNVKTASQSNIFESIDDSDNDDHIAYTSLCDYGEVYGNQWAHIKSHAEMAALIVQEAMTEVGLNHPTNDESEQSQLEVPNFKVTSPQSSNYAYS